MFLPRKELRKLFSKLSGKVFGLLLVAIASGLFTACSNTDPNSNNTGSDDKKLSIPAIDSTKVSPTPVIATSPAITPSNAPVSPTATISSSPKEPTPTIAFKDLPELKIGELETYKRGELLQIEIPKGWKLVDNSQPNEILVTWLEKAERATVSVNIFVPPSEIPENRLSEVFETIIKGMYGHQADFSMRSPVIEATGNTVIEWTSTVTIGDKRLKFQGNSRLQIINNKFAILTFGAIEPKFTEMQNAFAKIVNSQIVSATSAIP